MGEQRSERQAGRRQKPSGRCGKAYCSRRPRRQRARRASSTSSNKAPPLSQPASFLTRRSPAKFKCSCRFYFVNEMSMKCLCSSISMPSRNHSTQLDTPSSRRVIDPARHSTFHYQAIVLPISMMKSQVPPTTCYSASTMIREEQHSLTEIERRCSPARTSPTPRPLF